MLSRNNLLSELETPNGGVTTFSVGNVIWINLNLTIDHRACAYGLDASQRIVDPEKIYTRISLLFDLFPSLRPCIFGKLYDSQGPKRKADT